jgi:hypothetical protein
LLPVFALLSVIAACGGQEAPSNEAETGAAPAAEPPPATASAGGLSCTLQGATLQEAQARVSPHSSLPFNFGSVRALLCYGAPSARGREIMGGLVPYNGEPWRMGADEPTTLHLSGRANVGGVALEAGTYSLYAIPSATSWQVFINANVTRWGIPIDAAVRATEIGNFTVVPEETPAMVETLNYEWEDAAGGDPGGELLLEWERTLLRIPIEA